MATVCFVNPKGGVGKTTAALVFAEFCVEQRLKVAVIDLDPNANIVQFAKKRTADGVAVPFCVQSRPTDIDDVLDIIETLSNEFDVVIVDLEGSRDKIATLALSQTDLAIIPMNGSSMEARQAAAAIKLIKSTSKMIGRNILHHCLFTRVNAGIAWLDEREVRKDLEENGLSVLKKRLELRAPYTQIFKESKFLAEMVKERESKQGGQNYGKHVQKYIGAQRNAYGVATEIAKLLLEAQK